MSQSCVCSRAWGLISCTRFRQEEEQNRSLPDNQRKRWISPHPFLPQSATLSHWLCSALLGLAALRAPSCRSGAAHLLQVIKHHSFMRLWVLRRGSGSPLLLLPAIHPAARRGTWQAHSPPSSLHLNALHYISWLDGSSRISRAATAFEAASQVWDFFLMRHH